MITIGTHHLNYAERRNFFDLPLGGTHNLLNATAVFAAARADGIESGAIAAALSKFEGVRRRQEVIGESRGILVVDDFAAASDVGEHQWQARGRCFHRRAREALAV